jgi:ferricrocin synthase
VSLPLVISTLEKLWRAYASHSRGPEKRTYTSSSSLFNVFINSTRGPAATQIAQAFWTNYLASEKDIPTRHPPASFVSRKVRHYWPRLLENVTEAEGKSNEHGLSFQSLFLAAYAFVLAKVVSPDRIGTRFPVAVTIGVYLANRSLDIEGLLELTHPTFNVVPLRIEISAGASIFDVAKNVQRDLRKIGQIENCGVSLYEIYQWTGVRIDNCVNFLKLPEREKQGEESTGELRLESVTESEFGEDDARLWPRASPFIGSTPNDPSDVYLVGHLPLHDNPAYSLHSCSCELREIMSQSLPVKQDANVSQPSIDVEASIRNGGLDVGIFAPVDMINDQDAMRVLEELQSLLLSIGEGRVNEKRAVINE